MAWSKKNKRIHRFNKHQRKLKNPYFKKKKKIQFNWDLIITVIFYLLLVLVSLLLLYLFLYSPLFRVKNVEVVNNTYLSDYEVKTVYYDYLDRNQSLLIPNDNIFFLESEKLSNEIKLSNNIVQDVEIRKNSRNDLVIKIKEKETVGYWQSGESLYSFDQNGLVIDILNENNSLVTSNQEFKDGIYYGSLYMGTLSKYPFIVDYRKRFLESGDEIPLTADKLAMIIDIFNYINENELFMINNLSFLDDLYQNLVVKSLDGYVIYFSLLDEDNLIKSLDRCKVLFVQEFENTNLKNLDYIDLRMSEKVFYK